MGTRILLIFAVVVSGMPLLSSADTESNIAPGKKILLSDNIRGHNNEKIHKYVGEHVHFKKTGNAYAVYMLESVMNVNKVHPDVNGNMGDLEVILLNDFEGRCQTGEGSVRVCIATTDPLYQCEGQAAFVMVRRKSGNQVITIKNIEIWATSGNNGLPTPRSLPVEPIFINESRPSPSSLELRNKLLHGVSHTYIPFYSTRVVVGSKNVKPIIVRESDGACYLAAAHYGSGRVIIAGSHDTQTYIRNANPDEDSVDNRMRKWLLYDEDNDEVKWHHSNEVNSESAFDVAGGIILWSHWDEGVTDGNVRIISKVVEQGKAGLIINGRGYQFNNYGGNPTFNPVLDKIGARIIEDRVTNKKAAEWTTKGISDWNLMSFEERIDSMIASTELLTAKGKSVISYAENHLSSEIRNLMEMKKKIVKLIDLYKPYLNYISPCSAFPVRDEVEKTYITIFSDVLVSQELVDSDYALFGPSLYPGIPENNKVNETITYHGTQKNEVHPTGLYVPPGGTLNIEIVSDRNKSANSWRVHIGCHTDDIGARPAWERFRKVQTKWIVITTGKAFSGFGGIVWIRNDQPAVSITLKIRGAVRAPFFNVRDESNMNQWNTRRNALAPWAEIAGESFLYCVRSDYVRSLEMDELKDVTMNVWDKAIKSMYWLVGRNWKQSRRELMEVDIQTSAGSLHSGYPINAYLSYASGLLQRDLIGKDTTWGWLHEVGHNLVNGRWCPPGTSEVVNNIIGPVFGFTLWDLDYYNDYQRTTPNSVKKYIMTHKADFDRIWKSDPSLALGLYSQLSRNFGWEIYHYVFESYITKNLNPTTEEQKWDTFFLLFSESVNLDLSPMIKFWNISVSDSIIPVLKANYTKAFLPEDSFTQVVQDYTDDVIHSYNKPIVRSYDEDLRLQVTKDRATDFAKDVRANDVVIVN